MAAAVTGLSNVGAALNHWRRALALAGDEQPEIVIAAASQILALGWRQEMSESVDECNQVFETARALAERTGDLKSLASLTANYSGFRGIALGNTNDYVRYSLDAARIADESGDLALRCGARVRAKSKLREYVRKVNHKEIH